MMSMGGAPPLTLNHVNIPSRDPEGLRRWYVDVLGFRREGDYLWSGGTMLNIVYGTPLGREACWHFGFRAAAFRDDRRVCDLRFIASSLRVDASLSFWHAPHFGFRVADRAALDAWTEQLREHAVAVDEPEVHGEYATIYAEDPEGNTFEIYVEPAP